MILHSNRGAQFTCGDFQRCLVKNKLVSSMSAVGHYGDNAACEGFFVVLKRERDLSSLIPNIGRGPQ